ncbi:transglutaminase domain-containing protein [Candidatus Enterococcus mansonii]|uniref:Transglutaminase-like domain-containing protein n=1 Tax=Candidatus Enterococcus mansonii TaxID=1834181 RepID=A0A242CDU0_9ENTE|nr:transglutaminase domain-containing protein [Enterococcus sp. 4G2_DIV0659]OTO08407.1 hypothetical protein A5880_001407 [Enterococcus sp. 4G2_DIV0659]
MKKKVVVGVLLTTLILGACQQTKESEKQSRKEVTVGQLASEVKKKYKEDNIYSDEKIVLKREESIKLELGFDPLEKGIEKFNEIVEIFPTSDFTHSIKSTFKLFNDGKGIEIMPPRTPQATVRNVNANAEQDLTKQEKGWGNLPEYYMVLYVDLQTGKKLEKPEVRVFTVKHELSGRLRMKMKINDKGIPEFSWNKVAGAEYYYVVNINNSEDSGHSNTAFVTEKVEGTKWSPKSVSKFKSFKVSELDRQKEDNVKKYGAGSDPIPADSDQQDYAVIAVSKKGTSAISNYLDSRALASRIPYADEVSLTMNKEGSVRTDNIQRLPAYHWVTMCDGKLVQKRINYDISKAEETTETWGTYEKEDMSDLKGVRVDLVNIPYTVEGTGYTENAKVEKYNKKTLKKELQKLEERQNKLENKAGSTDIELTTADDDKEDDKASQSKDKTYETDDKITANSALSEYLAVNMLSGIRKIDLKEFPEANAQQYLLDAWMEAIYQNPLILGVEGASISNDGQSLMVTYNIKASDMGKKQVELKKEVKKIVSKIIKPDMTDLEKEYAINQYLCDNAEYDMKALESAEKNDFKTVDEKYNDSFTPYGVLINKIGVCASYAGAFKLLADEAKLETIVVTGFLDGDVPHAWNKVKINGAWNIVDSTNNDNELLTNALLNLPEKSSRKILVEDDRYVLDERIKEYKAVNEDKDNEYYHVENRFFDEDKITNELVTSLEKGNSTTLRTKYNLNDEEFARINLNVNEKMKNEDLQGFYWMGVIYLTKK